MVPRRIPDVGPNPSRWLGPNPTRRVGDWALTTPEYYGTSNLNPSRWLGPNPSRWLGLIRVGDWALIRVGDWVLIRVGDWPGAQSESVTGP